MKSKVIRKRILRISLGLIALCLIAVITLFGVGGVFVKADYLKPWEKSYSEGFSDPRLRLAAIGELAASNHNMQPWKIVLDKKDPMVFYLYADSSRMTPEVDPLARQMMISQGTFLGYVKIAGDEYGTPAAIELFPSGVYDERQLKESMEAKPVAKVTLTRAQPESSPLFSGVYLPDTNRSAYTVAKPTPAQTAALSSCYNDSSIAIKTFEDSENLKTLGNFAMQSARIESGTTRVMVESEKIFRANEREKNLYRSGYSVEGQGTSGIQKYLLQGLVTFFPSLNTGKAAADNFMSATSVSVKNTPAYAMILSADNSRVSQVKSGIAYSLLVLTGHRQGLVMQPLSQALEEYPEMQPVYKGIHASYAPGGQTIQMLVRFGQSTVTVPLSMRRDLSDMVKDQ